VKRTIYIGWDPREAAAWSVAQKSLIRRLGESIPVHALVLSDLMARGLYSRPMEYRADGHLAGMFDVISDAPMATEHACARFLVKELAKEGWALFMDGDVLVRADVAPLFAQLDPAKAVYCVQHDHTPAAEYGVKMDGQLQTRYARKNWSSVMAINCDHPANRALTVELVNTVPGRDLHRFCWLQDAEIGELGPEWNYLVGVTKADVEPKIAHFTLGVPNMKGWEDQPYAEEWRAERRRWAA
jgi:lipopolysaccharide biosynthesis glycosyltransferase